MSKLRLMVGALDGMVEGQRIIRHGGEAEGDVLAVVQPLSYGVVDGLQPQYAAGVVG